MLVMAKTKKNDERQWELRFAEEQCTGDAGQQVLNLSEAETHYDHLMYRSKQVLP